MVLCESCGINLNSNDMPFDDFCPYCNGKIDGEKNCKKCGLEITDCPKKAEVDCVCGDGE